MRGNIRLRQTELLILE